MVSVRVITKKVQHKPEATVPHTDVNPCPTKDQHMIFLWILRSHDLFPVITNVIKQFSLELSDLFQDDRKHRDQWLFEWESTWCDCGAVFYSHLSSTQLNISGRFWSHVLDRGLYMFLENGLHPSSRVHSLSLAVQWWLNTIVCLCPLSIYMHLCMEWISQFIRGSNTNRSDFSIFINIVSKNVGNQQSLHLHWCIWINIYISGNWIHCVILRFWYQEKSQDIKVKSFTWPINDLLFKCDAL